MARLSQSSAQHPLAMCHFGSNRKQRDALCRSTADRAMRTHPSPALVAQSGTSRAPRRRAELTHLVLISAWLIADIATIIAMSCLTGLAYHLVIYGEAGDLISFLNVGILATGVFVIPGIIRGEYKLANLFAFHPQARHAFRLWNATFICLLALGFAAKASVVYSRGWIFLFYVSTILLLLLIRYLVVQATLSASAKGLVAARRVYLIGAEQQMATFRADYEPWTFGTTIIGSCLLTPPSASAEHDLRTTALESDLDFAVANARNLEPDAVFLVLPWSDADTIERCCNRLKTLPVELHLAPERILQHYDEIELSKLGPLSSLQLTRLPLSRWDVAQKRLIDLVLATIGLITLAPALLCIAFAIRLDSDGPVLFRQRRHGFNQRTFRILKFRTMRTLDDGEIVVQATRQDPRITRVGRWLRRWNLDELPQLFNVIAGDMSLVGPRPHALTHNQEYERQIALYARRHNVRPGITGWAQIHGYRGETDTEKMRQRVEHDLYYIDNWSLWLDFTILARTILSTAAYRNAY